jgi:hypothetical protein
VQLERGHDGDLELDVGVRLGPFLEDVAEDLGHIRSGREVRVLLLGPHAEDEGSVLPADARRRDEGLVRPRERSGEHEGDPRRREPTRAHGPSVVTKTGFVRATRVPSEPRTSTRT